MEPLGEKPSASKAKRILVVDDRPDIARLMQTSLSRHGFQVESANSGAEALAMLGVNRPDLLITDSMMPEMDGPELIKTIRSDSALADLPIILLGARAADQPPKLHGADRPCTKPLNTLELSRIVKQMLPTD